MSPVMAAHILEAARRSLLAHRYTGTSTRKVANEAGVPSSQVHCHLGSKGDMVLASSTLVRVRVIGCR